MRPSSSSLVIARARISLSVKSLNFLGIGPFARAGATQKDGTKAGEKSRCRRRFPQAGRIAGAVLPYYHGESGSQTRQEYGSTMGFLRRARYPSFRNTAVTER